MRALLLGPNGQLGTDIQRVFAQSSSNIQLSLMGRTHLDVENAESINEILRHVQFDVLINCTSYHKTDEVELNATKAIAVNAHAVARLAEMCERKHARFVHVSTDYVFSGEKRRPYTETDSPAPLNVYGLSKYMGETLIRQGCSRFWILRVASLFGIAGASGKGGNFIETILRIAMDKGEVRVVSDVIMSPTSTKSVASMILRMCESEADDGIYHAVNSGSASWYEFASGFVSFMGLKANIVPINNSEYKAVARRPLYSVLSNEKISGLIGQIETWEEALHEYLIEKGHIQRRA